MITLKIEHHINFKCLTKLNKPLPECFQLLKKVFANNCMSLTQVLKWLKRFMEGREYVDDDEHSDHSVTSGTDENMKQINEICVKTYV